MMNNDDTFRWDCIKGTRAIKDEIDAEFPTVDALFNYLVAQRQECAKQKNTQSIKLSQ